MTSDPNDYEVFHSAGGNTDDDAMAFYLQKLHKWMHCQPCALVLDRYASHTSEATKETANALKIELIFIPTSATERFQPLDKRVFGALKSAAAAIFDDKAFEEQEGYTKPAAADLFLTVWKRLSTQAILAAWDEKDNDEEESSDEESSDSEFHE